MMRGLQEKAEAFTRHCPDQGAPGVFSRHSCDHPRG